MEIAKNDYYIMVVDGTKNRFYLTIQGFWKSADLVPNYLEHIKASCSKLRKGFTILTDIKNMKTPSKDAGVLHIEAQRLLVEAGLSYTAEIVPEAATSQMALKRYADESGMKKQAFATVKEAEDWLDSL